MHLRIETYEGKPDRLFLDGKPVVLSAPTFDVEDLAQIGPELGFTVEGVMYDDADAATEPSDVPNPRQGFVFVTGSVDRGIEKNTIGIERKVRADG